MTSELILELQKLVSLANIWSDSRILGINHGQLEVQLHSELYNRSNGFMYRNK